MVAPVSIENVASHIERLGISTVKLSVDDIRSILNTLVLDGKIAAFGDRHYRPLADIEDTMMKGPPAGGTEIPCAVCPVRPRPRAHETRPWAPLTPALCSTYAHTRTQVFHFCSATGPINPANCEYYGEWLKDNA